MCVYATECVYLIKAHLVRLLGRERQEAGGLQWRVFHFEKRKKGERLQRECEMWRDRGSQNVDLGSAGDVLNPPFILYTAMHPLMSSKGQLHLPFMIQ